MDDLVQNPEAQKLAQMLQQQQMQKFLQSMQGGMSGSDMEMAQRAMAAQPDYGMQSVPMTGQPMQQGLSILCPVYLVMLNIQKPICMLLFAPHQNLKQSLCKHLHR